MRETLAAVRAALGDRMLVVVSNREPYVHRLRRRGLVVERPVGGLVAALDPVLQATSGVWIAWGSGNADALATDADGRVAVPPDAPRYLLRRVPLSAGEVDGYYTGYANQGLWPLCHMAMTRARFRQRAFDVYRQVNGRFAEVAADEAPPGALVWIHDYHLALCARDLRAARPDLSLMHFWHIPWPSWEVFRACPQRTALLEGMLAHDLIGFQHPRHVEHFLACAAQGLGALVDRRRGVVVHRGRRVTVRALPISVDVAALDALARSPRAARWMRRLRRVFGDRRIVVSVDRLDYTKGILERLQAIEVFLERDADRRGRVVFVQKCAPSRTQIAAYRDLQRQVVETIGRINARYATTGWQPVVYLPRPLPPAGMAALYRLGDACVVTSLQDGMNLVAKEYVACQRDRAGVLVLSELAGAHDELAGALSINPYDADGVADAIARALALPADERAARMTALHAQVAAHDVYDWMRACLEAARDAVDRPAPALAVSDAHRTTD